MLPNGIKLVVHILLGIMFINVGSKSIIYHAPNVFMLTKYSNELVVVVLSKTSTKVINYFVKIHSRKPKSYVLFLC